MSLKELKLIFPKISDAPNPSDRDAYFLFALAALWRDMSNQEREIWCVHGGQSWCERSVVRCCNCWQDYGYNEAFDALRTSASTSDSSSSSSDRTTRSPHKC